MDTFRTSYAIKKGALEISYNDSLFFIGSCFSTHIYSNLLDRKFNASSNPYGILYNPISIFQALEEIILLKTYTKESLIAYRGLYQSFKHHSDFSKPNAELVLESINEGITKAHEQLKNANFLFISFGSAWVYEHEGEIVGNCHKMPNHLFSKRLLQALEIKESALHFLEALKHFNPKLQVIFTLSPVRHLKDGFEENSLSKAILRNAIYLLEATSQNTSYFPSYEIMMDDLRDYRFYENDMLHPNKAAIDYIFEAFKVRYFSKESLEIMASIERIQKALQHRVRFEESEENHKHQEFIAREKLRLKALGFDFDAH
ncbi:MAG: GSCFA domain-containing protein [Chitinophagales bacterium]|nr:GSCFA domain-containing protein [Chitinophagales bacterium]